MLRVLVVDDHPTFRRLVRRLLQAQGLEVIGEAATGAAALSQSAALRPDIVLLDVLLPDVDGFAVAERLSALPGAPAVLLTSSRAEADFGARLPSRHARGFVDKQHLGAVRIDELCGLA